MIQARRPRLELLSPEFIEKIVDEAFVLLEKHGVFIENEEAIGLLDGAGMRIGGDGRRAFLTRSLVE
ncbi:MAG TPA: hypothetical protein PLX50_08510, partial [Candidatus Aminicenantes bacterium]|nr:hypothetical protein [Candidatus Aminicenantes bacterium]